MCAVDWAPILSGKRFSRGIGQYEWWDYINHRCPIYSIFRSIMMDLITITLRIYPERDLIFTCLVGNLFTLALVYMVNKLVSDYIHF